MMELLRKRRSIRKFSRERVAPETVELLIEAALRAPSSRGKNPWEFILVDDPALLQKLAVAKQHGSEFIGNAPLAVVVAGDSTVSDVWIEDCAIAAIIIQLTALSLGLGSCWAQIRSRMHGNELTAEDYVRNLLGLPAQMKVAAILGIGHPAEQPRPVPAGQLQRAKIRKNGWLPETERQP